MRSADVCRRRTATQVTVYHQNPLAFQRQGSRNVHGQEGLTATGIEGSQQDNLSCFHITGHKLQIGTQYAEGFVHHIPLPFLHHHLGFCQRYDLLTEQSFPLYFSVLRNFTHKRQGKVLQILTTPHLGIHTFLKKDNNYGNQQA